MKSWCLDWEISMRCFFEDAKIASKELGLTLTKRNKEKGQDVPLAGVPYHSVASTLQS